MCKTDAGGLDIDPECGGIRAYAMLVRICHIGLVMAFSYCNERDPWGRITSTIHSPS